jgi:hypothetical protein
MGQIIKAVNNIYHICVTQQQKRGKIKKIDAPDVLEDHEALIDELIKRLEYAGEVVEDLVAVSAIEPGFDVR